MAGATWVLQSVPLIGLLQGPSLPLAGLSPERSVMSHCVPHPAPTLLPPPTSLVPMGLVPTHPGHSMSWFQPAGTGDACCWKVP